MNNLLLLGGNSPHNKTWIRDVSNVLSADFKKCIVHDYAHWENNDPFIDMEYELSCLDKQAANLHPYAIFAKSIGSVLALSAIKQNILAPTHCIFAGLPINLANENAIDLAGLIMNSRVPTLYIQNTNDPLASYEELVAFLQNANAQQYTTTSIPGNSHDYTDLPNIKSLAYSFINESS